MVKKRQNLRKKSFKKYKNHKGGEPVLPTEYFDKSSGNYCLSNGLVNLDAVSHGMENDSGSMGPNLSPYPEKFTQKGGFIGLIQDLWNKKDDSNKMFLFFKYPLKALIKDKIKKIR